MVYIDMGGKTGFARGIEEEVGAASALAEQQHSGLGKDQQGVHRSRHSLIAIAEPEHHKFALLALIPLN